MAQTKIGLYGGTFNPVHYGHLNLALEMLEQHALDAVWFCPAEINPHRLDEEPISAEHRLAMLHLATEKAPHFEVIDLEVQRGGPSYTVDTLRELKQQYPENAFYLILGEDAVQGFLQWKEPHEIISLAQPLIGCRSKETIDLSPLVEDSVVYEAVKKGVTPTSVIDVSSTEIRARLAKGLYCGHLLSEKIVDYIYTNHLYSVN